MDNKAQYGMDYWMDYCIDYGSIKRIYFREYLTDIVLKRILDNKNDIWSIERSIVKIPKYYDKDDEEYKYEDIHPILYKILNSNENIERIGEKYYIKEDMMRDIKIKLYLDL